MFMMGKLSAGQPGSGRSRKRNLHFNVLLPVMLVFIVCLAVCGCTRSADVEPSVSESPSDTQQEGTGPSGSEPVGIEPSSEYAEPEPTPGKEPSETETLEPEPGPGTDKPAQEQPETGWERNILIGTDIHYLAGSLTDGGVRFQQMVEHGDGKAVTYIGEITDAFLDEVIRLRPNALILSGDLTLDGEKKSHEELAGKLYRVKNAGIPVLVIPGNHDINNRRAARFEGTERLPAEYTTPEEFREIYRDFGYDEAISEDRGSLSYVYELDEENWLLMLDTCQYRPVAKVGGAILSDTYDWIEEQLDLAWDEDAHVIPVAHHNLLDESEIYVDDCTIEHGEQLVELLEDWDVPLFLSGHLHVQHCKRSDGDDGIWEMVTSSLATPACQYGALTWRDDGSFNYRTWAVDVEKWAADQKLSDINLINFNKFKGPFLREVFYNQSIDALKMVRGLTDDQKLRMSRLYSELNYHYYQGTAYLVKDGVEQNRDYQLWLDEGAAAKESEYLQYIIRDAVQDYNRAGE